MPTITEFFYDQFIASVPVPKGSFAGQTVIVTGANAGLGKEAARTIARLGAAKIILAVRNATAGEDARQELVAATNRPASTFEVWSLDLSSYESVQEFAARVGRDLDRVDAVVENAGICTTKFRRAAAGTAVEGGVGGGAGGHEQTITVNVISTFLLALLLLPTLRETARQHNVEPRLTIATSETHAWAAFPERDAANVFEALDDEDKTDMGDRYWTSKLLKVLVVRAMAPELEGQGVVLNMVNPGWCHSNLMNEARNFVLDIIMTLMCRSTEMGSRNLVAAAMAGVDSHGGYINCCEVREDRVVGWIKTDEGKASSRKVWAELASILETIKPGITSNLKRP